MVESFRPDVVVLDVMLPDVDGFTVLKRLRDRDSSIQVIFLTARSNAGSSTPRFDSGLGEVSVVFE